MLGFKQCVLASLLLAPLSIYAKDGTSDISTAVEAEELQQLLDLLQEQTSLATKSRLNADYVPGMITVLHGNELINKGVRTVWEALSLVPGIGLSIEETGRKQVVIRGIGRTYASGNSKILLNGTSMNSAYLAHSNPVMDIPVEQIERIEVIRGPGAAIHGEFALTGVINVVTRKDKSSVYLVAGENSTHGAGLMLSYKDKTAPLSVDLNLAGWQTDGADVIAGEDELYIEDGGVNSSFSNAPGPSNEAAEDKTAILSMSYDKFSFNAQWLEDGYGDHFGRNQFLPPDEKRIVTRNEHRTLEIRQLVDLSLSWSSEFYAGWQDNQQTKDDLYTAPTAGDPYEVDIFYRERHSSAGVDFRWTDNKKHNVLLGVEYVDINVDHELNEYQQSGVTLFEWAFVDADKRRRIISTTLQEELRPSDDLTLTFGLRYDEYNDIDSELSPRLASVWRIDQHNIFKAQYARSFRPPTFLEMSSLALFPGSAEIEGSTIDTVDLGYIYNNISSEYRVTLFISKIDKFIEFVNAILPEDDNGFRNTESAKMRGIEFELAQKLTKKWDLDTNVSYLDTKDNNTGQAMPGSTDWIANLGINYQPIARTNLALQYHYTGKSYRESTDSRDKLTAYNTTDFTLSLRELFGKNISFTAGIKNIFDEDVKYPAPMLTYVDDHPRAGRQWWLQTSYDF